MDSRFMMKLVLMKIAKGVIAIVCKIECLYDMSMIVHGINKKTSVSTGFLKSVFVPYYSLVNVALSERPCVLVAFSI